MKPLAAMPKLKLYVFHTWMFIQAWIGVGVSAWLCGMAGLHVDVPFWTLAMFGINEAVYLQSHSTALVAVSEPR